MTDYAALGREYGAYIEPDEKRLKFRGLRDTLMLVSIPKHRLAGRSDADLRASLESVFGPPQPVNSVPPSPR